MSSEFARTHGVVNKRGRGKARVGVVSPLMGRPGCPGREKDCLKPVGKGVGLSARIYDSNSLGDRARESPGSERRHAGTVEGMIVHSRWRLAYVSQRPSGRRPTR